MNRFFGAMSMLSATTTCMGAIVESYKGEANSFFVQTTIGVGVQVNLQTTIDLPGLKWSSPTSIAQFNRVPPGPADQLRLSGTVQHLVPIQAGDPVPGPKFEWFHSLQSRVGLNGDMILVYMAGDHHGSGIDAVCSITVAQVGPTDIDFWSNFLFGMHVFANDSISDLMGRILEEGPGLLKGATGVMIDRNGRKTLVGATVSGLRPQNVQSTKIRFGPPSSGGPTVVDLGGSEAWQEADGIGIAMQADTETPAPFVPALASGECYLEVLTTDLPPRRLVGRLAKVNASAIYAPSMATVELGIAFGGSVASLAESDDDSMTILLDELGSTGRLFIQGFVVFTPLPQLEFMVESRASRRDLLEFIEVKRVFEDDWDYVSGRLATTSDSVYSASVVASDWLYSTPATGNTQARMTWIPTADVFDADGWTVSVDRFEFRSGPLP